MFVAKTIPTVELKLEFRALARFPRFADSSVLTVGEVAQVVLVVMWFTVKPEEINETLGMAVLRNKTTIKIENILKLGRSKGESQLRLCFRNIPNTDMTPALAGSQIWIPPHVFLLRLYQRQSRRRITR